MLPTLIAQPDSGLPGSLADLLLVDFATNDQDMEDANMVGSATESLIRYVLSHAPNMAILFMDVTCKVTPALRARSRVTRAYGVPHISYLDWLDAFSCSHYTWQSPQHGGGNVHPTRSLHLSIAHGLDMWWDAFTSRNRHVQKSDCATNEDFAMPISLSRPEELQKHSVCHPISSYSALDGSAQHGVNITSGNWTLYADRPLKPGWISTGPKGSRLEFQLQFGAFPRLTLMYEQSYEGFGSAKIDFLRNKAVPITIDGHRHDGLNVTTAELLAVNVQDAPGNHRSFKRGFGIRPNSTQTLRVEYISTGHTKFKIRYVGSC